MHSGETDPALPSSTKFVIVCPKSDLDAVARVVTRHAGVDWAERKEIRLIGVAETFHSRGDFSRRRNETRRCILRRINAIAPPKEGARVLLVCVNIEMLNGAEDYPPR